MMSNRPALGNKEQFKSVFKVKFQLRDNGNVAAEGSVSISQHVGFGSLTSDKRRNTKMNM